MPKIFSQNKDLEFTVFFGMRDNWFAMYAFDGKAVRLYPQSKPFMIHKMLKFTLEYVIPSNKIYKESK